MADERTRYSSQRSDAVDDQAFPAFSRECRKLLDSVGHVMHPEPGEALWDAGDLYDLYLVLAGEVRLVDPRGNQVVFVVEAGDFVGELGMLMGQPAFLAGVATENTTLLRVRVDDLRQLVATSAELGDVLLSAFDARRRLLTRWGVGGLVLAGTTTTAPCTGCRSSPSGITFPTGRCCARTRPTGRSWGRRARSPRRGRPS